MPNHIHLTYYGLTGKQPMRDFKKYTSVHIRKHLKMREEKDFLFLQRLRVNAQGNKGRVFKLWQSRFDDLVLTDMKTVITKINYIHDNPVRKGLVSRAKDWFYSSANDYLADKPSAISVDKDWQ